jgi:biopolymer transport protein ExbB
MTDAMTLGELLGQAGWAMYPIYLCSVVAFAVFARKLVEVRALGLRDTSFVAPALERVRAGDYRGAAARCESAKHPAARVLAAAAETIERRPERAEAEAYRVGSLALQRIESHISVLSFIATVAPLLGLLGTVLGMVDLFMGLQGSGLSHLDPARLSAGIWKALLTTAAGLAVAVPTMAAHAYLASRTDRLRLQMSDAIQRVLTEAPAAPGSAAPDATESNETGEA